MSVGALKQTAQEREPHDFEVEGHRPVLNVIQVVLDTLFERGVAAPAVDLGPAGDSGLHLVAQHVLRDAVLELLDEERPFRPRADDRHIAAEDVEELRQFVEIEPSQPASDWRRPRVVLARPDGAGGVFRAQVHRTEFVDVEGLAIEAHALLPVIDRAGRGQFHQRRDDGEGNRHHDDGGARQDDVDDPLDPGVQPLERHIVDVDDRQAVKVLEPRPQGDELQQVRDDLDVDELAAGDLHQVEQPRVLLERERHVEMIDALALRDVGNFVERAEQREPAVADVVAAGPIVEKTDHLVAELAVLEDPIGDHPAQIAGAGDEDALEADAGAPAPFEQLTHALPGRVGEQHVQDEEKAPDQLRHLVRAACLCLFRGVVRLHVQGRHHAQHHRQDAADQHGEEIVDARAPPAQPIDALELEGHRRHHRDERHDVEVLLERGIPARHRDQSALEPDDIGQHERPAREQRVRDHVKSDEQAVVPSYHRVPAGAAIVSSITARICSRYRSREKRAAVRATAAGSKRRRATRSIAAVSDSTSGSANSTPFSPSCTVSSAPPRPSATTGRPHACASTGTIPKSSSPGKRTASAWRYSSRTSAWPRGPRKVTFGPATASSRARSGPSPTIRSGAPRRLHAAIASSTRLYGTSADTMRKWLPGNSPAGWKKIVSTGGYTTVATRL